MTIEVHSARSPVRQLRLVWAANSQSPWSGPRFRIYGLLYAGGLGALWLLNVHVALVLTAFVGAWGVWYSWAAISTWSTLGGATVAGHLRTGGLEVVSPSCRTWFPKASIDRWAVAGSCLTFRLKPLAVLYFDAGPLRDCEVESIRDLLNRPAPADYVGGSVIARWVPTRRSLLRQHRAAFQLVPRLWWGRVSLLIITTLAVGAVVAAAAVGSNVEGAGWASSLKLAVVDPARPVLQVVTITATILVMLSLVGRTLIGNQAGEPFVELRGTATELSIVTSGRSERISWSAIRRHRRRSRDFVLVTRAPFVTVLIPSDGFVPGGLELLTRSLEHTE